MLDLSKKKLNKNGYILIFLLKTQNNEIPSFKSMKLKLNLSLKRDEILIKEIKKNLRKYENIFFKFKVSISKFKYIKMVKSRYISCLLNVNNNELKKGINEIQSKYKNNIKFTDILNCISYKK